MNSVELPSHAQYIVIGGGIMGCGIAYHLAHEGAKDVILLEKAELTSGSTWHAAGQITHSTSSFSLGKCVDYNIGLYSGKLEQETGQDVGWHGCGSLRLAYSEDELDWFRHTLSVGQALGFNISLVDTAVIAKLHPFYNLDGVLGALHTPEDGHVDPNGVTQALAKGARQLGVKILRRHLVTNIQQKTNGEWRVSIDSKHIDCEHVINAAGTYARQIGEWSNLQLPMTSMTHHYFVTDTVPEFQELEAEIPVIRDDKLVSGYIRMEQKSGLIGIYEKENSNSVWEDFCPWESENELFEADYERIMPWLENAMGRMPIFSNLGIKREVHGAISHPPDGNPLIGPAPGVQNYWCCCGTQIGFGWGPGLTRELARWIIHGSADISMREFDPRRFGQYATPKWQVTKAHEDYKLRHEIPFPHFNRLEGRPIKPSPLFELLKEKGAVYEEVFGFERPRWFADNSLEQRDYYSFRRTPIHEVVANEVKAVRERVAIIDVTAFTKVVVSGKDAFIFLDQLTANKMPQRDGSITLTHMLNQKGRIELELTMVRLSSDEFYLVSAAFFEHRLLDHLKKHSANFDINITSKSEEMGALAINGPLSRKVLAKCTEADLSNSAFRWLSAKVIKVADQELIAMRMSYAGELGWELHAPSKSLVEIYNALWEAGKEFDIANYGSFAMNSMRMEKAFKGASELTNEVTLPEADVMRFVDLEKEFLGVQQTQTSNKIKLKNEMPWICAYLEISENGVEDGHGGEAVLYSGKVVGTTSSVAYGHSVGKILAFAYINQSFASPGTELTVSIAGNDRTARILDQPTYDPDNLRPRMDT